MKPPSLDYARPTQLDDAVDLLAASGGEGKVLAGGQSLMPLLNFRLAQPALLVDINAIVDLQGLDVRDGWLHIGAMTRTRALERDAAVRRYAPLLAAAAPWVGHPQIRNRGTIGGSLAHADPAAELPAVCVALDAAVVVRGRSGEHLVPAPELALGFLTTSLADDEILTEVRIPWQPAEEQWGFREFAYRRGDFALAGAAVTLRLDPEGALAAPRIAVFGTPDRPRRATSAEEALSGQRPSPDLIATASEMAAQDAAADDPRPDRQYRLGLYGTMVRRALEDALRPSESAVREGAR